MPPNIPNDVASLQEAAADFFNKSSSEDDASSRPKSVGFLQHEVVENGESNWDYHVDLEAGKTEARSSIEESQGIDNSVDDMAIRRYIRKKSSTLWNDRKELSIDEQRLSRVVRDAGFYSFGVVAVEVWELAQQDGWLKNPQGGYWRNPHLESSEALEHLEDPHHPEYAPPAPCMPGVGIPGVLWSASPNALPRDSKKMRRLSSAASFRSAHESIDLPAAADSSPAAAASMNASSSMVSLGSRLFRTDQSQQYQGVIWRDVKSLLVDPDTAKNSRLKVLLDAGFGMAAGVPFDTWGHKGIVVYLARAGTDAEVLSSTENQVYMMRATELVGATIGSKDARRASVVRKKTVSAQGCRKFRDSFRKSESKLGSSERSLGKLKEEEQCKTRWREMRKSALQRGKTWLKKCRGGDMQIPPPMSARQSLWTLLGVFCGLLVLSTMNEYAKNLSDGQYQLLIGPFGALMTLQYGLTAAPASQPRNAVLGQAVAGAVALSFTYIPEHILSTWLRRAIAPAFAITVIMKLGVPHPPAGAHSVIYASGEFGWGFYFLVVLATMISVIPATLVNNLSIKRQYPTFWCRESRLTNCLSRAERCSGKVDTMKEAA